MAGPFIDIWVNCPDRETAETIADALIAARLVACANIFPPVESRYRWKGRVETTQEIPLLLKTRAAHFTEISDRIVDLHPHEVPSVVATELSHIERKYADWLGAETGKA